MIIIGHRGYSAKFPENTISSFQAAMDASADMIEFDVLLSQDRIPVIIHDETLDRTTNGSGKVAAMKLSELKELNAGNDQTIPTLEEVLQLTQNKISLHVEIKSEAVQQTQTSNGVEEQVLQLLEKYGHMSSCVISSFSSTALFRVRQMNPHVATGMTFDRSMNDADKALVEKLKPSAIHLPINKIQSDDMDFASTHGMNIHVYTVNTVVQMKHAQELCVDGIFTNEVEQAIHFFTKRI